MSVEKNVPEIRFEGFSGEWEKTHLKDVSTYSNGGSFENDVKAEGRYELVTLKSVDMKGNLVSSRRYVDIEVPTLPKDTLVMILSEQSPGLLGMTARIPVSEKYVLNQRVAEIRALKNIESNFLSMAVNRNQRYFSERGAGTKVQNISKPSVENYEFLIPQKEEQTQIGNTFQKLDSLINQHQQKHDKLSNIKKAMLEKMFPKQGETTPEIRFKEFSGEWDEKELGTDVAEIIGGGTPSTSISEFWGGDIDWYSPTEIGSNVYAEGSQKKITALGLKSSSAKILPAGNTVLFTSRAGIGDMAILAKSGATNQGFQSFIVKEEFSPYFLYSTGNLIKEFALKHASGSTFLEISGKQLGRMKILMPNKDEQTKIGNYFKKLDKLIRQHQQQITKLNNIKQACLSKMFV